MKKLLKYFGVLSVVVLCLSVAMAVPAAVEQVNSGGAPYGYYDYSGCGSNYSGGYPGGYSGGYPGIYPYPRPTAYCVRWIPGQWIPVRVIVPGRWEYRRVWIPSYPTTLYRRVPGYWQPSTYYNGSPDLSVWRTPGNNWYATPYQQGQQGQFGGYFDSYGVWHSYSYPQGSTSVPEK